MSTDIITGNDLKAILGEVLPASQGVFCELIWTNPNGHTNLTCTMGESTVLINKSLSNYNGFIVEFRNYYNAGDKTTEIYFSKCPGMYGRTIISATLSNPTISYGRHWYPINASNGFYFSDCTRYSSNAASVVGSDTGCLVPLRIYGFKLYGASRQNTEILDTFYPVGSYYETSDISFDPNVSWGGTWVLETEGQVHVSAGTNYEVGDTGGATTHQHTTGNFTLQINHMPSHTHNVGYYRWDAKSSGSGNWGSVLGWDCTARNGGAQHIMPNGGGEAHNHGNTGDGSNMPPYIVVNRWHRTA